MVTKSDLETDVRQIYRERWTRRDGRKVPEDTDLSAGNDAVDIDATILYTDLDESTRLVDDYDDWFAAENYKTFLRCATKIIRSENGHIRSFDGDRVMGVFIGESKNTSAVRCALKIHWAVKYVIQPAIKSQYNMSTYVMRHVTGIDASKILACKGGIRNSNDIVWIGKAANHAAKLTSLPSDYPTWITDEVYDHMNDSTKFANGTNMWERKRWDKQNDRIVYRSNYWWTID